MAGTRIPMRSLKQILLLRSLGTGKNVNKKLPKGDSSFVDISGSVELSSLCI
jgi:hypothetical protein